MVYRIFFLLPMLLASFMLTAMEWNTQEEKDKDEDIVMEKNNAGQIIKAKQIIKKKGWAYEAQRIAKVNNIYTQFGIKITKRFDPKISMGLKMLDITDEQQQAEQLEAFQKQFVNEFKQYDQLSTVLRNLAGKGF